MNATTATVTGKTYRVHVNGKLVATGELSGTEGDLQDFLTAEAMVATGAEVEPLTWLTRQGPCQTPYYVSQSKLDAAVANAVEHGVNIDYGHGVWTDYIEFNNGKGSSYGRYMAL